MRERMQDKSFKAWINLQLQRDKLTVTDLTTDFGDGIKLIKLVENISEETLGKYHKNPTSRIQKIENINLPIKYINSFVASIGIKNTYSAENIIDQDKQFILGMVWTLILRFSINECSEGDMTAKEGLLQWAKKKVAEGSNGTVDVTNFHTSWQNGMAFNALINAFRPDLLNFESLKATNKLDNLNQAFDIAESQLGIAKILDAEDMVNMRPDEKSVMTYVSLFWKEFAANKRKNVAAERITDVVRREQALEDLTAQYIADAEALAGWANGKLELFSKEADASSSEEAEQELKTFLNYGRTEKPKANGDLLSLQALGSSLEMRLSALGRQFNPPAHTTIPVMKAMWDDLKERESAYEAKLKARLKALKKIELLIKIFNSRATKHEEWMATKMAWLQVRQKILRVSVAEGCWLSSVKHRFLYYMKYLGFGPTSYEPLVHRNFNYWKR
jgi:actinin alpha